MIIFQKRVPSKLAVQNELYGVHAVLTASPDSPGGDVTDKFGFREGEHRTVHESFGILVPSHPPASLCLSPLGSEFTRGRELNTLSQLHEEVPDVKPSFPSAEMLCERPSLLECSNEFSEVGQSNLELSTPNLKIRNLRSVPPFQFL